MPETPPPPPPCRITVDEGDLCELALRPPTEAEQDARLARIVRLFCEREGQI